MNGLETDCLGSGSEAPRDSVDGTQCARVVSEVFNFCILLIATRASNLDHAYSCALLLILLATILTISPG